MPCIGKTEHITDHVVRYRNREQATTTFNDLQIVEIIRASSLAGCGSCRSDQGRSISLHATDHERLVRLVHQIHVTRIQRGRSRGQHKRRRIFIVGISSFQQVFLRDYLRPVFLTGDKRRRGIWFVIDRQNINGDGRIITTEIATALVGPAVLCCDAVGKGINSIEVIIGIVNEIAGLKEIVNIEIERPKLGHFTNDKFNIYRQFILIGDVIIV